ncbi:hypothetical protein BE20_28340 [Sorangium cellulosum]|uniref:NERD domain-containing protein n=1 Tax=Sorangium cellulosum TaxID=56 RepID=A0A150S2G3_SORCE|nr:hypothetical protein BE18_08075 [Sorangium cellulosum]KYF86663.1 hypothetical protein BE20_28340 [Sorangium cellulosum]
MKAIDVERIRFEFGESWTLAEKWDESRAFLSGIGKLQGEWTDDDTGALARVGTKAVDIVGVREDRLYLIEVKDYRGYPIETKKRQPHELPIAIACKVRDTVAGLVGAGRQRAEPWVESCARLLVERKARVHVIAWIADPELRAAEPIKKREIWQKERSDRLRQRLSWLTPYVTVASPFDGRVGDVTAQSLPGAGQR